MPAMMSLGFGVLHLLIAMIAEVSFASSAGLEKGSHARVGVERLNPIADKRMVDMVSAVKACRCAGGKAWWTILRTKHLNLLRTRAMLGRMCRRCWLVLAGGERAMAYPVVSSKRMSSSSHVMPWPLGVVVPMAFRKYVYMCS